MLTAINGGHMPGTSFWASVVDTAGAILWPSGYYEVCGIGHSGASYFNLLADEGHWSGASSDLTLIGTAVSSISPPQVGDFSVAERSFIGGTLLLDLHRTGDSPAPPVRRLCAANLLGTVSTSGTGRPKVITAALTVKNPDLISRVSELESGQGYVLRLYAGVDSTMVNAAELRTIFETPARRVSNPIDTIPPSETRTYTIAEPVSDLTNFGLRPIGGRYYV